ncbi:diguanylate cyclase, partial [Microcoleus sp. HI-ES]|nr:diguanylate cyclase [Microcoleus sp. HI-ES]
DQLSIAIAQSFLLSQARQQARDEGVINQITSLLHSPLELNEIRKAVLEQTVKHLRGSGGRLYIAAEFGDRPALLYTCGQQPADIDVELSPFWQQIMGRANQDDPAQTANHTSPLGIFDNLYSQHYSSIDTNISSFIVPHLYAISD